jgi:hypothetical protein
MGQLLVSVAFASEVEPTSVGTASARDPIEAAEESDSPSELTGVVPDAGAADGVLPRPQPIDQAATTATTSIGWINDLKQPQVRVKVRIGKAPQNPGG